MGASVAQFSAAQESPPELLQSRIRRVVVPVRARFGSRYHVAAGLIFGVSDHRIYVAAPAETIAGAESVEALFLGSTSLASGRLLTDVVGDSRVGLLGFSHLHVPDRPATPLTLAITTASAELVAGMKGTLVYVDDAASRALSFQNIVTFSAGDGALKVSARNGERPKGWGIVVDELRRIAGLMDGRDQKIFPVHELLSEVAGHGYPTNLAAKTTAQLQADRIRKNNAFDFGSAYIAFALFPMIDQRQAPNLQANLTVIARQLAVLADYFEVPASLRPSSSPSPDILSTMKAFPELGRYMQRTQGLEIGQLFAFALLTAIYTLYGPNEAARFADLPAAIETYAKSMWLDVVRLKPFLVSPKDVATLPREVASEALDF
jgi:hypothetical protein